jgi:hypothetical protein
MLGNVFRAGLPFLYGSVAAGNYSSFRTLAKGMNAAYHASVLRRLFSNDSTGDFENRLPLDTHFLSQCPSFATYCTPYGVVLVYIERDPVTGISRDDTDQLGESEPGLKFTYAVSITLSALVKAAAMRHRKYGMYV